MKKNLLLLCLLLLSINVKATSLDSEYKFIGYSPSPLENNEHYKYEEVHLHKYYTIDKVNTIYAPLGSVIENSPYIDETDTIPGKYYLGDRSEFGEARPVIFMKLNESYDTNIINIINMNTYRDKINEIVIYNKNEKIEYEISPEYLFLNDGDIEHGESVTNGNFTLQLDNSYNLKDIRIQVYYDASNGYPSYFTIECINENGPSKTASIRWSNSYVSPSEQWLEFKVGDEYVNFLLDNNILPEEYAYTNTLRVTYEYTFPLYKHYDLQKVYYKESILDELEGYQYDSNEDIILYKVYAKDYLDINVLDIKNANSIIEKKQITNDNFVYHAIPVNNENVDTIITTEEKTEEVSTTFNDVKQPQEQKQSKKDIFKILTIISISLCLILTIYKLIRLLYDKFTGKY